MRIANTDAKIPSLIRWELIISKYQHMSENKTNKIMLVQYADITTGIKKWSMNATKEFTHVYYLLDNCILFKYFNYNLYCLQLRSTVNDFIQKAHGPHNSHEHRSQTFLIRMTTRYITYFPHSRFSSVKGNIFLENFCTGFLK